MTLVGLIGAAPRPVWGGARRCVCAKHAVVGAVVLLDGGSSWSAPGRAARCSSHRPPPPPPPCATHFNLRQVMDGGTAVAAEPRPAAAEQRGTYPGGAAKSTTSSAC